MGANESILHDVISHLVATRHAQGHTIDAALVATHNLTESIIISAASARD